MIYTAESLSAALLIGMTASASTIGSVLLDHFGLIRFEPHPAGLGQIVGASSWSSMSR